MISRMDKYETSQVKERTEKNKKLYEKVSNINVDYIDINFDNAIEINGNNPDNLTRAEYQRQKEISKIIPAKCAVIEEEPKELFKEEKLYDINEILKLARENKLFEDDEKKRLINTEYNILTKLDIAKIDESKDPSKENLRELINAVYGTSEKKKEVIDSKEETELFDSLIAKNDEEPILTEEISKDILDKEYEEEKIEPTTTIENPIRKEANEEETKTINTMELDKQMEKSKKTLTAIIVVVIILLLVGGFLFYKYFIS